MKIHGNTRGNLLTYLFLCGVLAAGLSLTGCSTENAEQPADSNDPTKVSKTEPMVIYSGRNKSLIEPILKRFEETTGIRTKIRYGGTAELAATLLEEGDRSPCDVFIAQDAAALGAISDAGLFETLPEDLLQKLDSRFRSPNQDWVGLSGRARVMVYNTERIQPEDLPKDIHEVAAPRYKGTFGLAPANASFQAHMAAYSAVNGEEALIELLEGITANEPGRYPKNSAIVEAVIQGEIDWGLVNHYYLWRALKENPEAPARNAPMSTQDGVSSFLNLAGAGALKDTPEAITLMQFLLSEEAQTYFAQETYEYPLIAGVEPSVALTPLEDLIAEQLDFKTISKTLEPTLQAISSTGLLQ